MIDPPDLSPGSSPWDTNRTNRTRSSGGKYESAPFLTPAESIPYKERVSTWSRLKKLENKPWHNSKLHIPQHLVLLPIQV